MPGLDWTYRERDKCCDAFRSYPTISTFFSLLLVKRCLEKISGSGRRDDAFSRCRKGIAPVWTKPPTFPFNIEPCRFDMRWLVLVRLLAGAYPSPHRISVPCRNAEIPEPPRAESAAPSRPPDPEDLR
jgi:hypothetical protein